MTESRPGRIDATDRYSVSRVRLIPPIGSSSHAPAESVTGRNVTVPAFHDRNASIDGNGRPEYALRGQLLLESLPTGSELPVGSLLLEYSYCRHIQISAATAPEDKDEGQRDEDKDRAAWLQHEQ